MFNDPSKELFTPLRSGIILLFLIVLACWGHVNFFSNDMRPFIDHDCYYLDVGNLDVTLFLYNSAQMLLCKMFSSLTYDNFFLYKMINLFFLVPTIVFTYLSASSLYSRRAGLVSAFFLITSPGILNIFHKSEINLYTALILSVSFYFYVKSDCLRNLKHTIFLALSLLVLLMHHYSSLLYLSVIFFVISVSLRNKNKKNKRGKLLVLYSFVLGVLACALFMDSNKYMGGISLLREYVSSYPNTDLKFYEVVVIFVKKCLVSLSFFKDYFAFRFDFYRYATLLLMVFYFARVALLQMKTKKMLPSDVVFLQSVVIVLLFLILLSVGMGSIVVFFAPLYVFIAVLNAASLEYIFCRYGKYLWGRVIIAFLLASFFIYGICSLFYPNMLVKSMEQNSSMFAYVEDDFNLNEHIDFYSQKKIPLESVGVIPLDSKMYMAARLYGLTLSFEIPFSFEDKEIVPKQYQAVFYSFSESDVLSVLKEDLKKDLSVLEHKAKDAVILENKGNLYGNIVLRKIIPYGRILEGKMDFLNLSKIEELYDASDIFDKTESNLYRESMVFIYEVA